MIAFWRPAKDLEGVLQSKFLITREPQRSLIQLSLSTPRDIEKASADNVDRTTRAIFFEDQVRGLIGAWRLSWSFGVVAYTMVPWNEDNCFWLANDASPKTTWVTWGTEMDRKQILVSLVSWASRSNLLAVISVWIVGCEIWTWISPSLDARSGLVWVTAYWILLTFQLRWPAVQDSFCGVCQFRWTQYHGHSLAEKLLCYDQVIVPTGCLWKRISFVWTIQMAAFVSGIQVFDERCGHHHRSRHQRVYPKHHVVYVHRLSMIPSSVYRALRDVV